MNCIGPGATRHVIYNHQLSLFPHLDCYCSLNPGVAVVVSTQKLARLRASITESLRVQRGGGDLIDYINVGHALEDACARQNHAIFARRGCGKTLLMHASSKRLASNIKPIYLNCEDFKRHTFPNVLIEILSALFRELEKNLQGWFGPKAQSRKLIKQILERLKTMHRAPDIEDEDVRRTSSDVSGREAGLSVGPKSEGIEAKLSLSGSRKSKEETERTFKWHREKLYDLDQWLPELKERIREFFDLSTNVKCIFLQIDDLYHLRRADQAFVIDYIHRLCKDVPLYFKVATIRHASTMFVDREGQPIGAQERHDYQPINIDYTFSDFTRTESQNWQILKEFAGRADLTEGELASLFKGKGFSRLVMAGGGVPRDVLSLFLEVLTNHESERIGKDEVRILSRSNLERRIEELKQDSQGDEQDSLLRGIYILREFCLEKKTNVFMVQEQMLQQNEDWRSLFNRLMDYRIIHNAGSALTHKSQPGNYQAFAIDIGCYAHFRKMENRFAEIDVSETTAKDKMRSAPVLDKQRLDHLFASVPPDVETALRQPAEQDT